VEPTRNSTLFASENVALAMRRLPTDRAGQQCRAAERPPIMSIRVGGFFEFLAKPSRRIYSAASIKASVGE
jgi:hypothetical protein